MQKLQMLEFMNKVRRRDSLDSIDSSSSEISTYNGNFKAIYNPLK